MANPETKDIQPRDKQEVTEQAEQTTPGPVFVPAVDIFETEPEITLVADMPGVEPGNLTIDLRDSVLTLAGQVTPAEGDDEEAILSEYEFGKYYRQFTLSEVVDQSKIDAELKNGVLRLVLPKVEKALPRKIEVRAG